MSQDKSPCPSRGEIWEVDWSPGRGAEQLGKRPALVIQNNAGNHSEFYPDTIVLTLSTKGRDIPFHVFIRKSKLNGLNADSWVKCEQIITVSKSRLVGKPRGRLTAEELGRVAEALKISLDLP